jgi:hypothetical protein
VLLGLRACCVGAPPHALSLHLVAHVRCLRACLCPLDCPPGVVSHGAAARLSCRRTGRAAAACQCMRMHAAAAGAAVACLRAAMCVIRAAATRMACAGWCAIGAAACAWVQLRAAGASRLCERSPCTYAAVWDPSGVVREGAAAGSTTAERVATCACIHTSHTHATPLYMMTRLRRSRQPPLQAHTPAHTACPP